MMLPVLCSQMFQSSVGMAPSLQHLRFMTFYDADPKTQKGWMNIGGIEDSLDFKIQQFEEYGIPSFYGGISGIFDRRHGSLVRDWESKLEDVATNEILPNLGPHKALRGVFFGDEICCHNATCWDVTLAPVATKLRTLLGPSAVLYTNECAINYIDKVPADLDLISMDVYDGYSPGSNGTDEVNRAMKLYSDVIFPKLHEHQQVMLVPGVFGCTNTDYMPFETMSKNLVDKLEGYWSWAQRDQRIAGFCPWHYNNRSRMHPDPCDMGPGAIAYPDVLTKLQEIGEAIIASQASITTTTTSALKLV